MSWRHVVDGDIQTVRRSRLGQGVAATVFLLTAGIAVLVMLGTFASPPEVEPPQFDQIMRVIGYVVSFILPFVAMLASYNAIIHERETGSIRFLLGLPNSRTDAYAGKYVSRATLLVVPLVGGFLIAGAIGVGVLEEPDIATLLLLTGASILYGLIFLGFGLTVSGTLDTETRVTTAMISVYVLFRAGWMVIQWGLLRLTQPRGERFVQPHPDWYYWVGRSNPINAFNKVVETVFPVEGSILLTTPALGTGTIATSEWFAAAVLVPWVVIAPLLGYFRFRNRDVL